MRGRTILSSSTLGGERAGHLHQRRGGECGRGGAALRASVVVVGEEPRGGAALRVSGRSREGNGGEEPPCARGRRSIPVASAYEGSAWAAHCARARASKWQRGKGGHRGGAMEADDGAKDATGEEDRERGASAERLPASASEKNRHNSRMGSEGEWGLSPHSALEMGSRGGFGCPP
jgi:hypothetical protein